MGWRTRLRDDEGVSYDARTGRKVQGRKLRQDGEKKIWTTDPDPIHPQRFLRNPGPDGGGWRPGNPAAHAIPCDVILASTSFTVSSGWAENRDARLEFDPADVPLIETE